MPPSPSDLRLLMPDRPTLQIPSRWPAGETVRYQLGMPFQISPTRVALVCNLRICGSDVIDFEAGADLVIFDDLARIRPDDAFPLTRNQRIPDPRTGKPIVLVKYPPVGGFVPLGASLPDGRPHPHAGTGFGIGVCIGFPADNSDRLPVSNKDALWTLELRQYHYDGGRFHASAPQLLSPGQFLPGWELFNIGLQYALLDGEDLLLPLAGGRPGQRPGAGLSRWRRLDGSWRPVSFVLVTGPDASMEPTCVRDLDGSLLFCARGASNQGIPRMHTDSALAQSREMSFLLWRSSDNGQTWSQIIDLPNMRGGTPVSLNLTADGAPFIAANTILPPSYKLIPILMREKLSLWPLSPDRRSALPPSFTFDCAARFGPDPSGSTWRVDHPCGGLVRLADGKLHSLLGLRICDSAEVGQGALPTPHTGLWLAEVLSTPA